jgi:hypothetical protein
MTNVLFMGGGMRARSKAAGGVDEGAPNGWRHLPGTADHPECAVSRPHAVRVRGRALRRWA